MVGTNGTARAHLAVVDDQLDTAADQVCEVVRQLGTPSPPYV
ncbi:MULTISPECIES: hypothetical protein [unclassified Streptomyces]